jgi:hypothetical protein
MSGGNRILAALLLGAISSTAFADGGALRLDPGPAWKVVGLFSYGPSYYEVAEDARGEPLLHAHYRPPASTAILGRRLEKPGRYAIFSWRWRVRRFPAGADEKVEGRMDSAAAVYLTLAQGLFRYVIKYVWSQKYSAGEDWRAENGPFEKMQLVVIRGPSAEADAWHEESIDIAADFRRYFGKNDEGGIPPVAGIGVLSDGDGTRSEVEADYAGFVLSP